MESKVLIGRITSSINSFIKEEFQSNPFDFLYEADIQSALWARLRKDINLKIKWNIDNDDIVRKIGKKSIETSIIKTQYPSLDKRFDLSIINPYTKRIGGTEKLEPFWYQPLLLAIELKYLQYGFPKEFWKKFSQDMESLKKREGKFLCGLALLFVQSDYLFENLVKINLRLKPVNAVELSKGVVGYVISQLQMYQTMS